jgi:hypothetical protein
MSIYAPVISEDEAQKIVGQVFRDTGYRLERRDPVIVQYVVQKMLLQDFSEKQARTFDYFVERTLPTIKSEARTLETIKTKFEVGARSAVDGVMENAGRESEKRIREVIHATDSKMLENLNQHVARLRREQDSILSGIWEQGEKFQKHSLQFVEAVDEYAKYLTRCFYLNIAFVVCNVGVAVYLLTR